MNQLFKLFKKSCDFTKMDYFLLISELKAKIMLVNGTKELQLCQNFSEKTCIRWSFVRFCLHCSHKGHSYI